MAKDRLISTRRRRTVPAAKSCLFADGAQKFPTSWSPDGRLLLFHRFDSKTQRDIWVLPLDNPSKPYPWLATPSNERDASYSQDGRWVAYASDESGRYEIYVAAFPGPGGKRQISAAGGTYILEATAALSDGRVLKLNSTVLCKPPGP